MSDAPFLTDLNQNSLMMLLDLVNHDNGSNITAKDISKIEISVNADTEPRNTSAVLHGANYPGDTVTVQYNRFNGQTVLESRLPVMVVADANEQLTDAIPTINTVCGLALQASDVVNDVLHPEQPGQTLKFDPQCPAWVGELPLLVFTQTEHPVALNQNGGGVLCFNGDIAMFSGEKS